MAGVVVFVKLSSCDFPVFSINTASVFSLLTLTLQQIHQHDCLSTEYRSFKLPQTDTEQRPFTGSSDDCLHEATLSVATLGDGVHEPA